MRLGSTLSTAQANGNSWPEDRMGVSGWKITKKGTRGECVLAKLT